MSDDGEEPRWRKWVSRSAMLVLGGIFIAGALGLYYAAWVFWKDDRDRRGYVRTDDRRSIHSILFGVGSFLLCTGVFLLWCAIQPPSRRD